MVHYLDIKNLAYGRGEGAASLWQDLRFTLQRGEILQITGPNGAGKSTLLKVLAGLWAPAAGQILWCGKPIQALYPEFHREMVFIGHQLGLKSHLTVFENLRFSLLRSDWIDEAQCLQALDVFGIGSYLFTRVGLLSAGEMQKVALARLFLTPAVLWILDEPFANLDAAGIAALQARIVQHCVNGGCAVISTHHALSCPGVRMKNLTLTRTVSHV